MDHEMTYVEARRKLLYPTNNDIREEPEAIKKAVEALEKVAELEVMVRLADKILKGEPLITYNEEK